MSAKYGPLTPERVAALANAFIDALADTLDEHEMAKVRERNAMEPDSLVCHSHDFCDANMVMLEAFADTIGLCKQDDVDVEQSCDWFNAAWGLAKDCGFAAPYLYEVVDLKSGKTVTSVPRTLGFFTEDTMFEPEDMHAINALDPGETYVKQGAQAALRVTRKE